MALGDNPKLKQRKSGQANFTNARGLTSYTGGSRVTRSGDSIKAAEEEGKHYEEGVVAYRKRTGCRPSKDAPSSDSEEDFEAPPQPSRERKTRKASSSSKPDAPSRSLQQHTTSRLGDDIGSSTQLPDIASSTQQSEITSNTESNMKVTKKTGPGGADGGIKHYCDLCSVDITNTVFIQCAEPICNEKKSYELCVHCFCQPKVDKNHNPAEHGYRVIEPNARPIYTLDWGADEELRLIEGAEKYGLGSWADIASHVGGFRTKEECEEHYRTVYVESGNFPLPELADANDTTLTDSISKEDFQINRKARIQAAKEANERAAANSTGPKQKPTASTPSCHEITGYMPGRLEFEVEYANEAEEVIQAMSFEPGDGINPATGELEPEHQLKRDVLEIYNQRLDQRAERKRVIFEHNLLDYRKNIALEKKMPTDEKALFQKVKPFAQLMNHEEFQEFAASQRKIHNLKIAIAQLQEWRRMGVTSIEDGEAYEKEKVRRQQLQQQAGAGAFDRLPNAGRPKPQPMSDTPSLAQLLTSSQVPSKLERTLRTGDHSMSASDFMAAVEEVQAPYRAAGLPIRDPDEPIPTVSESGYVCPPIKDLVPWDMSRDVPDIQHLLSEEISLCNACHIRPKPYFVIKEGLINASIRMGGSMKKKDAKALIPKLDPQKVSRIFDMFVRAGWINRA